MSTEAEGVLLLDAPLLPVERKAGSRASEALASKGCQRV